MTDLNRHNLHYYQVHGTHHVPDFLATAKPIQEAIRLAIETHVSKDPIRVLELGFGSRLNRYEHISATSTRRWDVLLTDFSVDVLPRATNLSVNISTQPYNLLTDPFPHGLYDAIISTYTFDSIDFPEDSYTDNKHYPGGLIRIAKEARHHLTPYGFFLTIDKYSSKVGLDFEPAGGARFKTLDLETAAKELAAPLIPLDDFLAIYHQQLPINLDDHACLMVPR